MTELAEGWRALIDQHRGDPPLDRALARLSHEEGGRAGVDDLLSHLDGLARGARTSPDSPIELRLARLLHHLFGENGFTGDAEQYDDPANSRLEDVLARRRGLPITLSVVMVEVGRRVELPLAPVGFPGHFLVATRGDPPLYLDAFHGGRRLHRDTLAARLHRILGRAPREPELRRALGPTAGVDVILRMSNNLVRAWLARGHLTGALRNADRRVAVRPDLPELWRDRGRLRAKVGHRDAAAADLEHYLAERPDAPDASQVAVQLALVLR